VRGEAMRGGAVGRYGWQAEVGGGTGSGRGGAGQVGSVEGRLTVTPKR